MARTRVMTELNHTSGARGGDTTELRPESHVVGMQG